MDNTMAVVATAQVPSHPKLDSFQTQDNNAAYKVLPDRDFPVLAVTRVRNPKPGKNMSFLSDEMTTELLNMHVSTNGNPPTKVEEVGVTDSSSTSDSISTDSAIHDCNTTQTNSKQAVMQEKSTSAVNERENSVGSKSSEIESDANTKGNEESMKKPTDSMTTDSEKKDKKTKSEVRSGRSSSTRTSPRETTKVQQNLPKWPLPYPSQIKPVKERQPISLPSTKKKSLSISSEEKRNLGLKDGFLRTIRMTPGEIEIQNRFQSNSEDFRYRVKQYPKDKRKDYDDPDRLNMRHIVKVLDDKATSSTKIQDDSNETGRVSKKVTFPQNAVELALKTASKHRRLEKQASLTVSDLGTQEMSSPYHRSAPSSPVEKAMRRRSATYEALQRSKYNRMLAYPELVKTSSARSSSESDDETPKPLQGILKHRSATFHANPTMDLKLSLDEKLHLIRDGLYPANAMGMFPRLRSGKPITKKPEAKILCGNCSTKGFIENSVYDMVHVTHDGKDNGKIKKKLNIFIPTDPDE